ncbi:MAG: DUF4270 domain-containing protein [Cytophagales bacterium]|nr:DUF4270 domain-containing protein [Cytophagales bacterium]MDW8385010.1 DUF4270 family protein [Flammeovirgaceae bacterium]
MRFIANSLIKRFFFFSITEQLQVVLLFFFITSCQTPSQFPIELQPNDLQIKTFFTDTISVRVSTVFLDSFFTSNTSSGEMPIGNLSNQLTGTHVATGFASIFLGNRETALSFGNPDSLIMPLQITDFRGNLSQPVTLEIYETLDTIFSEKNYTFSEKLPIGNLVTSFTFVPISYLAFTRNQLTTSISLRIPIEGSFKNKLLAAQNTDVLRLQKNFQETFKGFAFKIKDSTCGLSIKLFDVTNTLTGTLNRFSRIAMIQYFTRVTSNGQVIKDSIPFYYYRHFYHLESDYTTGKLKNIETQKEIPVEQTDYYGILQEGLPLGIKVSFPTLISLIRNHQIILNRAELFFQPQMIEERVPQSLRFHLTDTLSRVLYHSFLASPSSNQIFTTNYSEERRHYSPILLTRLAHSITNSTLNIGASVVVRPENSQRLRLLAIPHSNENRVKLRIFFTRY